MSQLSNNLGMLASVVGNLNEKKNTQTYSRVVRKMDSASHWIVILSTIVKMLQKL